MDLLSSESMEELKEKAKKRKGDKFMASVVNYADKYLKDEFYDGLGSQLDLQMQKVEARAEKAEKIATAKNLINLGSSNDFISKATGLKENIIENLRK